MNVLDGIAIDTQSTVNHLDSAVNILDSIETDIETLSDSGALDRNSTAGGTEKLTIPGDPFQVPGSAQTCREILIYVPSGNVGTTYLNIGAVADADDLQLQEDVWLSAPFSNTNLLNFFGTADDVVHLLWRN